MLATTEITPTQTACSPKIAIIIPVYKHSVLVSEAITCALEQNTEFTYVIIIVNDGCKFKETDRVARDFAFAYPDKVIYIYRPNGGLSAARNTGIDFALTTWDSVKAIYLLDADNRISPQTIDRSFRLLLSEPKVGWVYPTINMFGKEEGQEFDYRGEYSILRHLRFNTCEAGSMIRREVFDRGCFYDESMKLGFEDWEFWWQAIDAGYRGKHLPDSGFQYRTRFESMLSNSERDAEGIKHYMQRKHRSLLTHRRILSLEHQEAPRYAIFLHDTGQILLTSDPSSPGQLISLKDFNNYYHRARMMPVRYHRSHFLIFTSSTVLQVLQQQRLLHWVFWQLERVQETHNFASLTININPNTEAIIVREADAAAYPIIGETDSLVMTTVEVIDGCLYDPEDNWINSLLTSNPLPNIFKLELQFPISEVSDFSIGGAIYKLLSTFKTLRRSLQKQGVQKPWDWHANYLPSRSRMFEDARLALDCSTVYPILTEAKQKHIGFVLCILEFGGVEKVALNIAKVFYEAGWMVHLFIFGSRMQKLPEWAQIFTTINFYHEPCMSPWQGNLYMGTKNDAWSGKQEYLTAKGLLSWLDVAVNFHNATVNDIMGLLKRSGVKTVASLHVHDLSPWNRPAGHTYLTLGYEHAYDYIIPCSHNLADWCHGLGVPEEKIVVVANACGYPLAESTVEQILTQRSKRGFTEKLRVLFIGRFDRQKGLDRLVEIIAKSRQLGLPIHWRLIGKSLVKGEATANELDSIEDLVEPPALTTEALNQLYEWADVLLLPSYWEGLPLTILEAMRLGVVVCASDVGAVAEAVDHEKTGLIIPSLGGDAFAEAVIESLSKLVNKPDKLREISKAAATIASKRSWSQACCNLIEHLEASL